MSLHAVPWPCMLFQDLAYNFMSLHAVPWVCIQIHRLSYSSMSLLAVHLPCKQFHTVPYFFIWEAHKNFAVPVLVCFYYFWAFGFIRSSGFHNVCVCCVDHSQRGSGSTFYEYEYSQCQFFEHFGSWSTLKLAIMLHWEWYWLNMNICMYKFDIVTEYCDSRESIQMQTKS